MSAIRVPAWSGTSGSPFQVSDSLHPHVEESRGGSQALLWPLSGHQSPSGGSTLMTSSNPSCLPRPHLSIAPQWGGGFQYMNFEGHKHSAHNWGPRWSILTVEVSCGQIVPTDRTGYSETRARNLDITANPVWLSPLPALRSAVAETEDLLVHYQALASSWATYFPQL